MSDVMDDVKGNMLERINAIRTEYNAPKLSILPRGTRGNGVECSGHRALRDLGFCRHYVSTIALGVKRSSDADRIAKIWGTHRVECSNDVCIEEKPNGSCGLIHVALPSEMTMFVEHFDDGGFPELLLNPKPHKTVALAATSA